MTGYLYRLVMRIAHRYHWHYAPPVHPDGDTLLWCQWCGLRYLVRRRTRGPVRAGIIDHAKAGRS